MRCLFRAGTVSRCTEANVWPAASMRPRNQPTTLPSAMAVAVRSQSASSSQKADSRQIVVSRISSTQTARSSRRRQPKATSSSPRTAISTRPSGDDIRFQAPPAHRALQPHHQPSRRGPAPVARTVGSQTSVITPAWPPAPPERHGHRRLGRVDHRNCERIFQQAHPIITASAPSSSLSARPTSIMRRSVPSPLAVSATDISSARSPARRSTSAIWRR